MPLSLYDINLGTSLEGGMALGPDWSGGGGAMAARARGTVH